MDILFTVLIGYFIGCINPTFILGKIKGRDVKKNGSGNAGASNALILFGKFAGVFCALFDIFKAFLAVIISRAIFGEDLSLDLSTFVVAAVACVLGHIFPFYMKFRGGKGLACIGGMVLAYNPVIFLVMFLCAIVFVLLVNYICFVPIAASIAFAIIYGINEGDLVGALILGALAVIVMIKHRVNLKRIMNGTEFRISYLWNKNKELERCNVELVREENPQEETANET